MSDELVKVRDPDGNISTVARHVASDLTLHGTPDPITGVPRLWSYADTPAPEPRLQPVGPSDSDDASPVSRMKEAPPSSDAVRALAELETLRAACREAGADVKSTYGLRRLLAGRARAGCKP